MDWNQLFYLPEWDEEKIRQFELEGDEWKNERSIIAARALYQQWQETFYMAVAIAETLVAEVPSYADMTHKFMYENLMIVGLKLLAAAGTRAYVPQMENAAIIRQNCKEFMDQLQFAWLTAMADKEHIETMRESMAAFKERFKEWVATFEKDDHPDEWGVFV